MRTGALAIVAALTACSQASPADADAQAPSAPAAAQAAASTPSSTSPAEALVAAYPGQVARIEDDSLVFTDGTRMPLSDGRTGKTEDEIIDNPDIDDMFAWPYPSGEPAAATQDPGRARNEAFYIHMYGDCRRGETQRNMRDVAWMPSRGGGSVRMSTVNGAADRLEAVVADLERLPPAMTRYLVPNAGTLVCRNIAGTNRLSAHGYGVAIDINTAHSDYWLWAGGESARWRNRIPYEIVEIFERHGFIWGGRWRHFDTMHFEYRPEYLLDRMAEPPR